MRSWFLGPAAPVVVKSSDQAITANARAQEAKNETHQLRAELDRLTLVCAAMWELLGERGSGLNESDLTAKIEEIDLRDGKADGKVTKTARTNCPKCSRPNGPRHRNCLYCGEALGTGAF